MEAAKKTYVWKTAKAKEKRHPIDTTRRCLGKDEEAKRREKSDQGREVGQ